NRFCSISVTRINSWYGGIDSEEAGIDSEMLESIPGANISKFPSNGHFRIDSNKAELIPER
ncbi:hypothetical protein PIB30_114962, partial [Stylosanthes scabra]|nr:hypothetical protein [Stylosanthes scabra]